MEHKQNLHTHTDFCDGADTPEELVIAAIEKGFESIGFSGHSYMSFLENFAGRMKDPTDYKNEIYRLKEKYADKIKVYCGLEVDVLSSPELSGYEYLIASVHYLNIGGKIVGFDRSLKEVKSIIDNYFGGSGIAFAKKVYETAATIPQYGDFDILGHFDLAAKHIDSAPLFDEDSKEYKAAVTESLEALAGKVPFFEVNTGGIPRGYRKRPYPSPYVIKEMKRLGFGAVISSDCHNKHFLDYAFDDAAQLLICCGFKERYILTDNGFKGVKI